MDLKSLGYVVAVVDQGGFGKAADALGITQPSLSHGVKALENELGAQLFHRLGRSVALTPAGEALLGPARQALRDADVDTPLRDLGIPQEFHGHGTRAEVLVRLGLTAQHVARKVTEWTVDRLGEPAPAQQVRPEG